MTPSQSQLLLDFTRENYDLNELFDLLNRQYWSGCLPQFRVEWTNRMITTWGICYADRGLIRISSMFKNRPVAELRAILAHEMIHIKIRGHGRRFHKELQRIGLAGDVQRAFPHLNQITQTLRRAYRFVYECPRCRVRIKRRLRIRGYCLGCYHRGVTSRFRLAEKLT